MYVHVRGPMEVYYEQLILLAKRRKRHGCIVLVHSNKVNKDVGSVGLEVDSRCCLIYKFACTVLYCSAALGIWRGAHIHDYLKKNEPDDALANVFELNCYLCFKLIEPPCISTSI